MAAFNNFIFLLTVTALCLCEKGVITFGQTTSRPLTSPPISEPEPEPTKVKPSADTSYGEPETEPKSEPENTSPEPEGGNQPFAEPVPVWDDAFPMWKAAWEIHIYGMGVLFALLAIYSLISIIRLRKKRLLSRGYFVALNLMMLTMGVDRAVYLLVDAYNHKLIWPPPVAYMLIGLGFPCLTSAFSILLLALLQSTRTQVVPPKIQRPKFLAVIIVIHFTVSLASDVIVGLVGNAQALLLVCQGAFLIWGISLSISYLIIFRRLYKSSVRQFREITRLSMSRRSINLKGVAPYMKKPQNRWGNAIRVTVITSLMGLVTAGLQLYGASVVYGPFATEIPKAWPWWSYQFIFRVAEFVMCALMSFVATQPFRYTSDGHEKPCTVPGRDALRYICCCACNRTDHEINDAGDDSLWNTNMFESAQLDSDGNPVDSNAVTVGLDPLETENLTLPPVNENGKENTKDFSHSPPRSPDSLSPIMEFSTNQNANTINKRKTIGFDLNEHNDNQEPNGSDVKSASVDCSMMEQTDINTNSNNSSQSSPVRSHSNNSSQSSPVRGHLNNSSQSSPVRGRSNNSSQSSPVIGHSNNSSQSSPVRGHSNNSSPSSLVRGHRSTDDAEVNMSSVSDKLLASRNLDSENSDDKIDQEENSIHLLGNTTGESV